MTKNRIDLSNYENKLGKNDQFLRFLWKITWTFFAKPLSRSVGRRWKIFLVNLFGGEIHQTANIYSSATIYSPWNLKMDEYSCLGSEVDCYNPSPIYIGAHSTVSQKTYLCSATHDITKRHHPLILKEIKIEDQAWIAADSFIGPGVTIGQGAVVGARAAVFKDVQPWTIVGGNPAEVIGKREITDI